jgi:hypothetical protein
MSRGSISLAALLWLVIAFLVLYPLSILVVESFKIAETGGWGIGNYLEFFQDAYYLKCFGNTLLLSTLVLGAAGLHFGAIPALGQDGFHSPDPVADCAARFCRRICLYHLFGQMGYRESAPDGDRTD